MQEGSTMTDPISDWIVGAQECTKLLRKSSWKSAKRWIKKYNAPLRRWIDGKPAFLRSEFNQWLLETGEEVQKKFFTYPK